MVSTATRVGMGNLVGVVAAISVGGAGAVFWMWVTALLGASTAFAEATLAQIHKEKDPLYGGYRGGPAYYIHNFSQSLREEQKAGYEAPQVFPHRRPVCRIRTDLLVRHQSGDQQFGELGLR